MNFVLLSYVSFFKYYRVFWAYGVLKCNKLAVHFKLTLDMIFVVLYKYLSCHAEKIIDKDLVLTVTINYRIILLMILFITSWCKPLKTDPSGENEPMPLN